MLKGTSYILVPLKYWLNINFTSTSINLCKTIGKIKIYWNTTFTIITKLPTCGVRDKLEYKILTVKIIDGSADVSVQMACANVGRLRLMQYNTVERTHALLLNGLLFKPFNLPNKGFINGVGQK